MKIMIAADLVPTESNQDLFINQNIEKLLGKELYEKWLDADFRVFNLECALCDKGTPIKKFGPNLKAHPNTILGISALKPNLILLANNHIGDFGEDGTFSTTKLLEQHNLNWIGIGKNLNEMYNNSYIFKYQDKKIGFYCCAEHEFTVATETTAGANPYHDFYTNNAIYNLKKECDYIIIFYHGGREHYRYPSPELQKRCRLMCENGADFVICQHSHCIGCEEKYKNSTILYGQGNFIFDHNDSEYWQTSLIVEVEFNTENAKINYIPIIKTGNTIQLANKSKSDEILNQFTARSEEIKKPHIIYNKYLEEAKKSIYWYLSVFETQNILAIRNYLDCEAHRELISFALKELPITIQKKDTRKEPLIQKIFSIKNQTHKFKKYKVITLAGVKIKIHKKSKLEKLLARKYDPNLSLEDKKYIIEKQFERAVGYKPNIDNPRSFNEKLQWLKLYNEDPLLTKCADKYLVRDYVKEKIGEEYLIPLLGVWDSPDEIDFDKLPNQFVLKVNWGSGQNIIVKDKSKLDIEDAKAKLKEWMKPRSNHYYYSFEWSYKNIKPKIIAEQFIQQLNNDLYDYKFFSYRGKVKNLFVVSDRFNKKYFDFYDTDWNKLPFERLYHNSPNGIAKPQNLDKMISLAERLSKDFPFVRVDFYDIEDKIYFGEITFYPGSGLEAFEPIEWDYKLGEMLTLPTSQNGGGGQDSVPDKIPNK